MILKHPWSGRSRAVVPFTAMLILLLTITTFALAAVNASRTSLRDAEREATFRSHGLQLRLELVSFWITVPAVFLATSVGENIALWTDNLRPQTAVLVATVSAIAWLTQFGLWGSCVTVAADSNGPAHCPAPLRDASQRQSALHLMPTMQAATWLALPLVLIYCVHLSICAAVYVRQQREEKQTKTIQERKSMVLLHDRLEVAARRSKDRMHRPGVINTTEIIERERASTPGSPVAADGFEDLDRSERTLVDSVRESESYAEAPRASLCNCHVH